MNILFLTRYPITDQRGGIERITDILIKAFPKKYAFFSIYLEETNFSKSIVKDQKHLDNEKKQEELFDFVKQNKIDIIINQQCPELVDEIYKVKEEYNVCTLYFQHDIILDPPKAQREGFKLLLYGDIPLKRKILTAWKYILFPLYRNLKIKREQSLFRKIYKLNDYLLILSDNYKQEILKTIRIKVDVESKIRVINNCLTIKSPSSIPILHRSKKVLIVSRMTEDRKRILLALKIWLKLNERFPNLNDWELEVVGSGEHLDFYKKFIKKTNTQNINFRGQVLNVETYYQNAQIFLMTSYSEGWGLTITEAQQFGVIPIAFNSYAAITDLICDGENGILIPEGENDIYVNKLAFLMSSDEERIFMSENAKKRVERFSPDKIISQWEKLFEKCKRPILG